MTPILGPNLCILGSFAPSEVVSLYPVFSFELGFSKMLDSIPSQSVLLSLMSLFIAGFWRAAILVPQTYIL